MLYVVCTDRAAAGPGTLRLAEILGERSRPLDVAGP